MQKSTLFYHPRNPDCKKAQRLLHQQNHPFHLSDISANGASSYLLKDMDISELPALCVPSPQKYTVYQGLRKIEAYLRRHQH